MAICCWDSYLLHEFILHRSYIILLTSASKRLYTGNIKMNNFNHRFDSNELDTALLSISN